MHNTHTNPGLDNPFRLMFPRCHFAFHGKTNQKRTNIPFNYTGRWVPKAQRGPLQKQVAAFQGHKIHFKNFLSLPHGNHLLSSIITRPHTARFSGACICHLTFVTLKNSSVHFFIVYTKKSLQTTLSFFWDLEDLSGTYLKITTNIYAVFYGYLEGPLVRFFGFCSNPLSRLGLHFCNVYFFWAFAWTM